MQYVSTVCFDGEYPTQGPPIPAEPWLRSEPSGKLFVFGARFEKRLKSSIAEPLLRLSNE